jgi:hypothetical protein
VLAAGLLAVRSRQCASPLQTTGGSLSARRAAPTLARRGALWLGVSKDGGQNGLQDLGGALLTIRSSRCEVDNGEPDGDRMEETRTLLDIRRIAYSFKEQHRVRDDSISEFSEHFAQTRFLVACLRKSHENTGVFMTGDEVCNRARGVVERREFCECRGNGQ